MSDIKTLNALIAEHQARAAGKRFVPPVLPSLKVTPPKPITRTGIHQNSQPLLTAFGKTKTVLQWAAQFGVKPSTIKSRIESGWTPEQAVSVKAKRTGEPLRVNTRRVG